MSSGYSLWTVARRSLHTTCQLLHKSYVELGLKYEGGREALVRRGQVNQAYSQLKNMCNDAHVRKLWLRRRYYTKPKHRRQEGRAKYEKERQDEFFKTKIQAALELMRRLVLIKA